MAQSIILTLPLILLLCTAGVLADQQNEDDPEYNFSKSLKIFSNGASRNLMQNFVRGLSKYLNKGHNLAITPAPLPTPAPKHPVPLPAPAPKHHGIAPVPAPTRPLDCDASCKHRCSLHSRQNVCQRACGTCCLRCKCVPPGTSGNRELCGTCYTNMTTHGMRPKCP